MLFIILIAILMILLFLPVEFNLEVYEKYINLNYKFLIFFKFSYRKNLKAKILKHNISSIEDLKNEYETRGVKKLQSKYNMYKIIMEYLYNKIYIKELTWITKIGLIDSALTAICIGLLWSLKSFLTFNLLKNKKIEKLHLDILPYYNQQLFDVYLSCIFKINFVYIIIASIKLLRYKRKVVKK